MSPFPDDSRLDSSEMKALADNKLYVALIMNLVDKRAENIVGKGENDGNTSIFSLTHNALKSQGH